MNFAEGVGVQKEAVQSHRQVTEMAGKEGASAHGRSWHCAGRHHHVGLLAEVAAQNAMFTHGSCMAQGGPQPP